MGWFPLGRVPQKLRTFPGLRLVWNSLPFCDKLCAKHLGETRWKQKNLAPSVLWAVSTLLKYTILLVLCKLLMKIKTILRSDHRQFVLPWRSNYAVRRASGFRLNGPSEADQAAVCDFYTASPYL